MFLTGQVGHGVPGLVPSPWTLTSWPGLCPGDQMARAGGPRGRGASVGGRGALAGPTLPHQPPDCSWPLLSPADQQRPCEAQHSCHPAGRISIPAAGGERAGEVGGRLLTLFRGRGAGTALLGGEEVASRGARRGLVAVVLWGCHRQVSLRVTAASEEDDPLSEGNWAEGGLAESWPSPHFSQGHLLFRTP